MSHVEALLEEKMGLDADSIGAAAVLNAVRGRMQVCDLPHLEAYWNLLCISEEEQQELIEAVVVPETWFFRDREAFGALGRIAVSEWACADRPAPVRILSLPCATGEEPFSIAMTLLDAGLLPGRFLIDAADISERAIVHAGRGVYGRNSFRGSDVEFRERHFERVGAVYRLSERVRAQVTFRQANLFTPGAFPGLPVYDVIFCRNVLIYFDWPARKRAIDLLAGLLNPDGVLFVGPAEAALLADHGFASLRVRHAFAFRRAGATIAGPKAERSKPVPCEVINRTIIPRLVPIATAALRPKPAAPATLPTLTPYPSKDWVVQAQNLADQGKLAEAMECCERHLRHEAPSAQAFYLLGLLHDAGGNASRAREHYRKALYLEPTHHEALVHLAATLRTAGDVRGAERLLERARRAQSGGRN